ncbi:DNA polymerase III subunit alpha [Neorickettsia findlayensis]|uniref:DNA polymerase III subunit alpha n=1 Tax=Neorickettsia findlayensis TaxID=2686014 RepID=A0A6P1G9H3_9RICK|nr:DNA polymerase III subunit alpha [Neorickettsia findlayensis]QHD64972.1 DNA polymerase III subunit alpha [Neorickettsia findlayensis]
MRRQTFVHLRVRSDYSLLRAVTKPRKIVDLARAAGMPAVALTDIDTMAGALEFAEYAKSSGIQPIIGIDLSISHNRVDSRVLLIAKNEEGFHNMIKLSRVVSARRVALNEVFTYSKGLILLLGEFFLDAINSYSINAETLVSDLKQVFDKDLFIEIQRLGNQSAEEKLIQLGYECNIPFVATNDVLFPNRDFREAHDVLTCIGGLTYVSDINRVHYSPESYFKSAEEMFALFSDLKEALHNTVLIARRCSFMPEVRSPILPKFECERDENDELRRLSYAGLQRRMGDDIPQNYLDRLEYELGIIIDMNYSGYFLIVADFIRWSKANDIVVGPGRGSGVGSIVAWCLGITGLDPLKFALFFERFLNPVRVSMPDFDVDFCQERRHLVIEYVRKKYGHVAQIMTFGTLQPRAALRDVGRVLQLPYGRVDRICKMIPNNPANPISLQEAINLDKDLQKESENDESIAKLLDLALKLEGTLRHASTHAAGIVISDTPIENYLPIYHDKESDIPVTQYSMKYVEKAGLIKFDFLGLKTLTVINQACSLVRLKDPNFDMDSIPLNDKRTYELLSAGNAIGVFQLDNAYMCETLKRLHPDCFEDIIALISLNRPGPMANIPTYIARKHGKETVKYPHPLLESSLKETFGVVIYQEQVMEMVRLLAGYTLAEADILRRVMGKKIRAEMSEQTEKFVEGAKRNGIDAEKAREIFEMVEKFAGYGFNKSHAAAYALISYQTAFLKANFPIEFTTAALNLELHHTDKLAILIQDAKNCGITILPPDINKSKIFFSIEGNAIRYSLAALKNVGEAAASAIEKRSPFKTIAELQRCLDGKIVHRKAVESLIKSGSLDVLSPERSRLYSCMNELVGKEDNSAQIALFDISVVKPEKVFAPWNFFEKTQCEFDALGFFLYDHPLSPYQRFLKLSPNQIAGVITELRIRSRGNRKFAVMHVSTVSDIYTVVFYESEVIDSRRELFVVGVKVVLTLLKSDNGYVCSNLAELHEFIFADYKRRFAILVNRKEQVTALKDALRRGGKCEVIVVVRSDSQYTRIILGHDFDLAIEKLALIEGVEILKHRVRSIST